MPFKIVYTKLWGSPRPIAKKTDLMSVHSGALVATFVNNLVYTYKSQILCLQVSVLIIHGHCIQLSFSRAGLSKKFICILSVSLDFFPDLL